MFKFSKFQVKFILLLFPFKNVGQNYVYQSQKLLFFPNITAKK